MKLYISGFLLPFLRQIFPLLVSVLIKAAQFPTAVKNSFYGLVMPSSLLSFAWFCLFKNG
jgi:hypothetical protein